VTPQQERIASSASGSELELSTDPQHAMSRPDTTLKSPLKPNWSRLTKIGAISAAIGSVSLHLMGQVAHRVYLQQMGVSAGHFPKTTDWLVINGYYTLGTRFLALMKAFFAHTLLIALAILVFGVYMYGMEVLGRWLKSKAPALKLAGLPAWASDVIRNLLASAFVVIGIPVAVMFVMLVLLLPAVVGETAGKDVAAKEMTRFMAGCDRGESNTSANCSQIVMDGKVLATGYVIDASQSHVAIFDPETRRTTVMETAGKTVVGKRATLPGD
jgi:hypothetical protein